MKRVIALVGVGALVSAAWLMAQQPAEVSLVDGFRTVEVASVSDAMEQLYGQRGYMAHDMRPLRATKFAGPAVTVQLKKEEHKEGSDDPIHRKVPVDQGSGEAVWAHLKVRRPCPLSLSLVPSYSYRSARIGSIRLARRAGMRPAAADTTVSSTIVDVAIKGSLGLTP